MSRAGYNDDWHNKSVYRRKPMKWILELIVATVLVCASVVAIMVWALPW